MPIYEYRCTRCGDEIEVMQKMSDRALRKCGKCSGRLEKLISRTSFQLKGGGWFDHGYGSGGKKDASSKSGASKPSSSSGDKPPGGDKKKAAASR
jgi:putative FmdB family regulatory protein